MAYTIGSFGFVRWEGPRPAFTKQHIQTFTKTGQAGISALALGVHGDSFDTLLGAVYADETTMRVAEVNYRTLIGASPQILTYEGTNYATVYNTLYLVEDVSVESAKRHPRLIGPGYNYLGGWMIRTRWRLRPVA